MNSVGDGIKTVILKGKFDFEVAGLQETFQSIIACGNINLCIRTSFYHYQG